MVKDELKNLGARKELLKELETFDEKGLPINPMECVAKGASLKAAKIAKPNIGSDPNAYGTMLWPVPNQANYFYTIIPSNSNYPISRSVGIVHHNPEAQAVPIPLIKRLVYDENGQTVYKYYHLGDYDCFIRSTGDNPEVDITMQLTPDKILVTTFTHRQSGAPPMTLEKLNDLAGQEIELQEATPPPSSDSGGAGGGGGRPSGGRKWTQQQFEQAIHAARSVIDQFAERSQDARVIRKKEQLLSLIQGASDPDAHTHDIMSRILELLNLLKNAGQINEGDFHAYRQQLKDITRNR
jgi:hypothetical protein